MFACGAIGVVSVVGFGEMQLVAYEFAYLVAVAERFEEHVAVDSIFFECRLVVAKDAAVARPTACRSAAGAHCHEVEGKIAGGYAVDKNEPEQTFEVGGHLIGGVEGSVTLIYAPPAVEARVGGHEAATHEPTAEALRGVVAHAFCQVGVVDIVDVAVHGVDIVVAHSLGHLQENVAASVEVVGIKDAHHVARGHADALVHGVVDAIVGLAYPFQLGAEARLVLADDVDSAVLGAAVHHNVFIVGVVLAKHRFKGVA